MSRVVSPRAEASPPDRPPAGRGDGETITLTLPLPPRRQGNADRHWRYRYRAKNAYLADCDLRRIAKLIPPPPEHPPARVVITVTCTVRAPNDVDNLMARCKWTLDWLKREGYVVDDSPAHLLWASPPSQVVSRTQEPSVTLTLTPP